MQAPSSRGLREVAIALAVVGLLDVAGVIVRVSSGPAYSLGTFGMLIAAALLYKAERQRQAAVGICLSFSVGLGAAAILLTVTMVLPRDLARILWLLAPTRTSLELALHLVALTVGGWSALVLSKTTRKNARENAELQSRLERAATHPLWVSATGALAGVILVGGMAVQAVGDTGLRAARRASDTAADKQKAFTLFVSRTWTATGPVDIVAWVVLYSEDSLHLRRVEWEERE